MVLHGIEAPHESHEELGIMHPPRPSHPLPRIGQATEALRVEAVGNDGGVPIAETAIALVPQRGMRVRDDEVHVS